MKREADAMIHEPSSLLGNAKSAVHLIAADAVLAVGDHPNCSKPLPEIDWAILEYRSDLGGELAARVLLFALPKTAGTVRISGATEDSWSTDITTLFQLGDDVCNCF